MLNVQRLGDICSGHGCFPPRPIISSSPNVFANSIPISRVYDSYSTHCCGSSCHGGYQVIGSPTVYVNGRNISRLGDLVSCGSIVLGHSPNVYA